MKIDEMIVRNLVFLCRTYDGVNKLIVSSKNRLQALNPEAEVMHQDEIKTMKSIKDKIARKMKHELKVWPIWTEWLIKVPGISAYIASNLIILYYYRFISICPKCEAVIEKREDENGNGNAFYCPGCDRKIKGDGILTTKIEEKDFPSISSWRAYLGFITKTSEGKKPKRKKGIICNWSSLGRLIMYHAGEEFVKQKGGEYRNYYEKRREYRETTHSQVTKMHKYNMARNETASLFASHFWIVARTIDEKPLTKPWILEHGGHVDFIPPYYWEEPPLG